MQCLHQDCTMVLTIEKEMRGSTPFRLAMFLGSGGGRLRPCTPKESWLPELNRLSGCRYTRALTSGARRDWLPEDSARFCRTAYPFLNMPWSRMRASRGVLHPLDMGGLRALPRRELVLLLLLGLAFFSIYNANQRSIAAGDTYSARYLPLSILKHHRLTLDPVAELVAQGRPVPTGDGQSYAAFWMIKTPKGNLVSLYPIVTPLVVAPLYLPAVAYLDAEGWAPHRVDHVARIMEKLCASLMATLSAMLLYLLLRRRGPPFVATLLTVAYALGTTTWTISSQALWLHGLGGLLVVALLYLLTGPSSPVRVIWAGLLCALLACNRQPDAILAAGFGLLAIRWSGVRFPLFVLSAAVPVGLLLAYNLMVVGHLMGGYGLMPSLDARVSQFGDDTLFGVWALLFSPVSGLFVFSPFLLFVILGIAVIIREPRWRGLTLVLGLAWLAQVFFYGATHWVQGLSWGPRYLTDALPILMWMLVPVVERLRIAGRLLFIALCMLAVAIHAVGAFFYTGQSLGAAVAAKGGAPEREVWKELLWNIDNAPFIAELRNGWVPPDFDELKGSIDQIEGRDLPEGSHVQVDGWALMDGHTPADVVLLVDGHSVAGTEVFFERVDVVRTLGEREHSGWQVLFPTGALGAGRHELAVLVRAHRRAQQRLLGVRQFTIESVDDRLSRAAQDASRVLMESQESAGYWLSEFSSTTQFALQGRELNLFINAALIEVMQPVAQRAGLVAQVERARQFLSEQIEGNGLVRYHGRPDLPTMGVMGCVITPDADDTALAWRIAPGGQPALLSRALATLKQYRTPDGLYQTWLAPKSAFQCIDPGSNPNPPDIGIQLHVYLLLAEVDPPAARALCSALQKRAEDESLWVYYRLAPPIILLRLNSVSAAGCPLQLPAARLRTTVAGQEAWGEMLAHLAQLEVTDRYGLSRLHDLERLLDQLAAGEFAAFKRHPPLLYHNDLSASVSRYYWSEAFGYALWLRLYHERERLLAVHPVAAIEAVRL